MKSVWSVLQRKKERWAFVGANKTRKEEMRKEAEHGVDQSEKEGPMRYMCAKEMSGDRWKAKKKADCRGTETKPTG